MNSFTFDLQLGRQHLADFNDLVNFGPNLAIQDPMLLQHFYMGLSGETAQFLDTISGCAFLHCFASEDGLEDVVEKTPEVEPMIVEPEPLATPLEASTIF